MSNLKIQPAKPFVVFLYGFPGSGKTAFARQLAQEINMAHVQQDRLSMELYGEISDKTDGAARNATDYMTREFLRAGVSVIYDANVPRLAERRLLRDTVRKAKATPVMIWLQIDPESAFLRTQKRDRRKIDDHYAKDYTPENYEIALKRMQNPDNEEYIVISGKHTYQTQRSAVFKRLYELGVLTPSHISQNIPKPELVNLVPQIPSARTDITRRNINIR
jgi:predicted kinase